MQEFIFKTVNKYKRNPSRLLDIFWDIQDQYRYVSLEALCLLEHELGVSVPQLKDCLTFYHFFDDHPAGKQKIYLDISAIAEINGNPEIIQAFEQALNCKMNSVDPSGNIGLFTTSCIGMSDQLPAALVNGCPVTNLTVTKVKKIVHDLRHNKQPATSVEEQVYLKGPLLLASHDPIYNLNRLRQYTSEAIIQIIKDAGLRGSGGAGFSTGLKWEECHKQKEQHRYLVCNADEGEPGTFKDRYLLSHHSDSVIEGIIIASYAIAANEAILYLRAEYRYLQQKLQRSIDKFKQYTDLDIRIQLGAGAYVVGEESAMLESIEGKRGEPRVRPPYPSEKGLFGKPTVINNVETLFAVTRIIAQGTEWFKSFGTKKSYGSKLLSISGDCQKAGIYEVEWGISINELLQLVQAKDVLAIQIGGPSGIMLNADQGHRRICFEDIPTGGSIMIFNKTRDILSIIKNFTEFFVQESCGACTPCRAGNLLFLEQIEAIESGEASLKNLEDIKSWHSIISQTSRCGLGKTCANPLLTSMQAFPDYYKNLVSPKENLFKHFDVEKKTQAYKKSVLDYEKNKD